VSQLANLKPVVTDSLETKNIQTLLQNHPFAQFPVRLNGKISGLLTREEATRALRENRSPHLVPATFCSPDLNVHAAQTKLIESASGFLLLQNQPDGPLEGIVTLHDLLRTQQAAAEAGLA
jgi:CBS domain containing-hemolysin-like protein